MTLANQIVLEVVTKEGVALKKTVDEVTAPSVNGDFGVLPGHRPLLVALRTGIATYRVGTEEVRCAVGPGFAQISDDKAVLLTDTFCRKEEVDAISVRQELREADDELDSFTGELGGMEHGQLIRKSRWAATRLELYGDPPPPTIYTYAEFQTTTHPDYVHPKEEEGEKEAP